MYRYEPFQMKHSLSQSSYGILGKVEQDGIWITVAVVAAFSDHYEAVSLLAEKCTRLSLSPGQLLDVVTDFITQETMDT
ncbi:MAG: hypothetical protein OSJ58_10520 [Dysosmobacter sp.]|nr:hypothetical protein [Dysosmobacter sp.]